ncbi:uncharacterized protein isoform X3 [Rhodnius prolixus]|uniref:uncharacterized protein isoform X3 n=1 Tax=Rhodnius prolixus TaxID=13249 RepID=UPI003D18DA45
MQLLWNSMWVLCTVVKWTMAEEECGGLLTRDRGLLHTPGFPRPFQVPLKCRWVIDSSMQPTQPVSIVVYLTQLFVTTGLTFTEYAYYEPDSPNYQLEPKILHTVTEENVAITTRVATNTSFLVVEFNMDRLEGNHLRASDGLLEVYGLNITYIMHLGTGKIPDYSCTAAKCSMLGHCYASLDYSSFWCACFPGFTGPNCKQGPLCRRDMDVCRNGATCRHVGANDIQCDCAPGYVGKYCEKYYVPSDCKQQNGCIKQCRYEGTKENHCTCDRHGVAAPKNLSHFECTLRLVNMSSIGDSSRPLEQRLQKQMTKYLKGANLARIEDAKVLNVADGGEIRFHFVGARDDGSRVRELLMTLVEKARLANFTLNPTHFSFKQEPTLLLQSVTVDKKEDRVRLGDNFTFTCQAQGSSRISFHWFKDGAPINGSIAVRKLKQWERPQDSYFYSYLSVEKADPLDEGEFTCQVIDWGIQQCKSVRLSVIQPLHVNVSPMSATVVKGSNLTLRCYTTNKPVKRKLGYNWTKNKALFPMVPGERFWEDLYPDGSILKLHNIQKGGLFSCQAVDGVWYGEGTSRIDVLDKLTATSKCAGQGRWSDASPGLQVSAHCPSGYTGTATRQCLLIEPGKGRWQVADYSGCTSHQTNLITNNFLRLTLGYEGTSVRDTVFEVASWLGSRQNVHPGEGEPLIVLLAKVLAYINDTQDMPALVNTTPNFFTAVSALMLRNTSIINQQTIINLEEIVRTWSLLWAKHTGGTFNHLSEGGIVVNTFKVNPMQKRISLTIPRPGFSYPRWLQTSLSVEIDNKVKENDTVIAIIVYRDLGQFFPKQFSQKLADGSDLEFNIALPVVSVATSPRDNNIQSSLERLELMTRLVAPDGSLCGLTENGQVWDLTHCNVTRSLQVDTVCLCPNQGLFAALHTRTNLYQKRPEFKWRSSLSVLVGATCCLVQSLLTVVLLAYRTWRHRSCVLFLKLQCSCAIATTMSIFIYTSRESVPRNSYLYISISLQLLLLMAMSSQLAKFIIIYSEVINIPMVKYFKQTVIIILTGLCGVCGLSTFVVADYATDKLWWWLRHGTTIFYITTSYAGIITAMYCLVGADLILKLVPLSKGDFKEKPVLLRRIGLMKRSVAVFVVVVAMATASVFYANNPSPLNQSIFSITCGATGFTIFACYVVMSENAPRNVKFMKRLHLFGTEDHSSYSSTSDNSYNNAHRPTVSYKKLL